MAPCRAAARRGQGSTIEQLPLNGWTPAQREALALLLERASIPAVWDLDSVSVPEVSVPRVDVFMDFLSTIPDDVVLELAETSDFDPDDATRQAAVPPPPPIPDVALPRYRLGVFLVDAFVCAAPAMVAFLVFGALIPTVTFALTILYPILMIGALGRTVGNFATRTRVVRFEDRARPTWRAAVIRGVVPFAFTWLAWVGTPLDLIETVWYFAVYVPILFKPEHRGLHDRAAGVMVLDDRFTATGGVSWG
jgi:uncharacterized RDD family membrane protein YckC